MKYRDVTLGQVETTIDLHGGYDNWLRMLRGELAVQLEQVADDQFVLDLNYDAYPTLAEMFAALLASGAYNNNPDATFENFPIEKRAGLWRVTCELVHPNNTHSTEYARGYIQGRGCQSPRIEVGLAFGATHKDVQRKHPIVIACSPWAYRGGDEVLPVLNEGAGNRGLSLILVEGDWGPLDRWLAVRTEVPLGS